MGSDTKPCSLLYVFCAISTRVARKVRETWSSIAGRHRGPRRSIYGLRNSTAARVGSGFCNERTGVGPRLTRLEDTLEAIVENEDRACRVDDDGGNHPQVSKALPLASSSSKKDDNGEARACAASATRAT